MSITIRQYTEPDFEFLFAAFNSCVEWLASKGLEGQWGAEPWGASTKERLRAKIPKEAANGARQWIAEIDGEPVGYLDITPFRPDYLPASATEEKPGSETFVKNLVVHRKFVGRGVGDFLLQFAKRIAVEEKTVWLRLDCWRGPAGKDGLVRYYEGHGFVRAREFVNPPKEDGEEEWPGQQLGSLYSFIGRGFESCRKVMESIQMKTPLFHYCFASRRNGRSVGATFDELGRWMKFAPAS